MKRFHNDTTLYSVAKFLQFDDAITALNSSLNYVASFDELKEGFESLLGACYSIHGFVLPYSIVYRLWNEMENFSISLDDNYIGKLGEYAQNKKLENPDYNDFEKIGPDNDPKFSISLKFNGYEVQNCFFKRKKEAEIHAAFKMLLTLKLIDETTFEFIDIPEETKVTKIVKTDRIKILSKNPTIVINR